jgi:BMFP domain-containing protein YqiC
MQQHEINTEVNKLLQKLTKCVEQLGSTGTQQIEINGLLKDELIKTINKIDSLDQRVALLEARNQITDKVSEVIDVRPN